MDEMELFHKNYQKLRQLIARSRKIFEKLNLNEESLNLKPGESFRILTVGKDRSKRIDLINSLAQRNLLNAADLSACAAGITVRCDERERAVVHFINEYSTDISEEDLIPIDKNSEDRDNKLKIEIPVSKLHKYIPLNRILDSIDIFMPDSFYMDGIEIIDIPELQSISSVKELNELAGRLNINLILFIASEEEIREIIHGEGMKNSQSKAVFNSIFYVIDASENINNDEKYKLIQGIKDGTRFMEEGIFFISNSIENNNGMISIASIRDIRNAIHQEHRKESLYKPLYELTRIIKETILRIIAELYATAEGNAQDVEMIYNRSITAVKRAQLHRENINDRVVFFMERIKNSINEEVNNFLRGLPADIQSHMKGAGIKQTRNPVIDIYEKIEEQVDIEMYEWIINSIIPLIDASIKGIVNEEEYSLKSFCYEIDNINRDYGRAKGIKQPAQKYISAFEKFSGLLKTGDREELNQYIKSINESLVSKIIFSKKIFLISSSCIEGINMDIAGDLPKCHETVLNLALEYIRENSSSAKVQISEEIFNQIEAFFEYIKVKINFEIERVQSRVEYLQEYKNKLQRATDLITECERELKEIDNELIELVFETMGT